MAAKAPQRGEPGFAAAQRAAGGDPRVRPAEGRSEPATAPRDDATGAPSRRGRPASSTSGQRRPSPSRAAGALSSAGRARPLGGLSRAGRVFTKSPTEITVDDGAGLVLGMFAWILVMQYLRGGMPQVNKWLRAKFLNYENGRKPA